MNKKGQALIEFVLILPILLIILMALVDVGSIFISKYELNKDLDNITTLFQSGKEKEALAYAANENIEINTTLNSGYMIITVKKNVKINAPILSNIIGKNHAIEAKTAIYGEEND